MRLSRQLVTAVAILVTLSAVDTTAGSPVASASNEQEFLHSVASEGYPGDSRSLDVGRQVCKLMDQGLTETAIERYIADSVSIDRSNPLYEAALFSQYATYNLCPPHQADYGGNI